MRLLSAALSAASRLLGVQRDTSTRHDRDSDGVPEHVKAQRERAARAKPRAVSRFARAWAIVRAGFLMDHGGRMDPGQRHAMRGLVRRQLRAQLRGRGVRTRPSLLLGDGLAWRTISAQLEGRTRGPSGAKKRRTRAARLTGPADASLVDAPA